MGAADTVLAAVRDVLPAGPLVVALSGGADSAVVGWACVEVAGSDRVELVHIDHGLEGSATMRAAANLVAEAIGLPLRVIAVELPPAGSEETNARVARLAALERVAADARWIVTGHHRDDAAETLLGNLLRGAGATGLAGMAPTRGHFVRPLLDIPGSTIRDAADELRLPYRDDPANRDLRHRRNVLRHEVLPQIEAAAGPGVHAALHRTAGLLSADDALLEAEAARVPLRVDARAAVLPASLLTSLPRPIAARVVRRALRTVRPPYPGSAVEVAAVLDVAGGAAQRQLLEGWHAVREGAEVAVTPVLDLPGVAPVVLGVPGKIEFGHGHTLSGRVADGAGPRPIGRAMCHLDGGAVGSEFDVRPAHPGERVELTSGSKPVREALAEAGVPVRHRSTWPVLAVHGRIAWLPGARVAAWAQAGPGAGSVVVLAWERTNG